MSDEDTVTINGRAFRVVGQRNQEPRPPASVPPGSAHSSHEPVAGKTGGRGTKYRSKPLLPNKYRNKVVITADGERIDSRTEARRWAVLQAMEKDGEIRDLVRQPVYVLAPSVRFAGAKKRKPELRYVADFSYIEGTNRLVVEDVKSPATAKTAAFRIKRHLLKSVHGIDVRIVK